MSGRLQNKVALVLGAASGIGAAIARRFVAEGARVVAAGLPQPDGGQLPGAEARYCDVTDDAQVRDLVARVIHEYQRIDVLVNAAGVIVTDAAATVNDADWRRIHDVNLGGAMRSMRAVLPHMASQRSGAIVNIASVAAFNAGATRASYAASKAGLVTLTRSAAQSHGEYGVRANALCPGWVDTPMSQAEMQELAQELNVSVDAARAHTVSRVALGRMASPEEIAAACLFLASDEASFVTGAALVVDGGARIAAAARAM